MNGVGVVSKQPQLKPSGNHQHFSSFFQTKLIFFTFSSTFDFSFSFNGIKSSNDRVYMMKQTDLRCHFLFKTVTTANKWLIVN